MRVLFPKVKYPKFLLLVLTYVVALVIFHERAFFPLREALLSLGYIGIFLAGLFYTYGFTSAPATAVLIIFSTSQDIYLTGALAGLGALFGDLFIFRFIRSSLTEEIGLFSSGRIPVFLGRIMPAIIKKYLFIFLGSITIASPLPDEIGVALLAGATRLSLGTFSALSYTLNTLGIYIILFIGTMYN